MDNSEPVEGGVTIDNAPEVEEGVAREPEVPRSVALSPPRPGWAGNITTKYLYTFIVYLPDGGDERKMNKWEKNIVG